MTRPFDQSRTEFYLTSPSRCPYLPDRMERKVFTFLSGTTASQYNAILTQRGFRRSQNIVYLPACDACNACKPVRVVASALENKQAWRRNRRRNADVSRELKAPKATSEQFSVLRGYLDERHADGGMSDMTVLDYTSMVEQTAVDTMLIEYRDRDGMLIACALTDRLPDGLSMVYSFFEPDAASRGLGTYMILDHVALAGELGLPYVYLGYWIDGSTKMDYKAKFAPLEQWSAKGWKPLVKADTTRK